MSAFALVVASVLILVCRVVSAFVLFVISVARAVWSAFTSIFACKVMSAFALVIASASIFACRVMSAFVLFVISVSRAVWSAFKSKSACSPVTSLIASDCSVPV